MRGGRGSLRVIGGRFRGRRLVTPRGMVVRPTADRVKEAMFNILGPRCPGARVLDLYAGTGSLGIEALSRGAVEVTFVERDSEAVSVLEKNLAWLPEEVTARVCRRAVVDFLARPGGMMPVNIVLGDPPYGKGLVEETLESLTGSEILAPEAVVVFEQEAGLEALPSGWRESDRRIYGDTAVTFYRPR